MPSMAVVQGDGRMADEDDDTGDPVIVLPQRQPTRGHHDRAGRPRADRGPDSAQPTIRLRRHRLQLADGHAATITTAGQGIPLVLVHGFSLTGQLYVQTLSRLAGLGFRVVAVDLADHGGADGSPATSHGLARYSRLLSHTIEHLGIPRAILVGHSLGGRLVAELGAAQPERVIALVLLDAGVGQPWDRLVELYRLVPSALGLFGAVFLADTLGTVPFARDLQQAAKLARLALPTAIGNLTSPWRRLLGPGLSALHASASTPLLDRLRRAGVPVVVIHGDCDLVVPLAAARDAARRTGAELVIVHGATHSWLLQDPETLPGIMRELLHGRLGRVCRMALADAGLDPTSATTGTIDAAFCAPDAVLASLQGTLGLTGGQTARPQRAAWYRWSSTGSRTRPAAARRA